MSIVDDIKKYRTMLVENSNHDVESLFKEYFTYMGAYTIDTTGYITTTDKNCYVALKKPCERLPVKFLHVAGNINCNSSGLESLEGFPRRVGYILCADNKLTSLEGCSERVDGSLHVTDNQLTSLKGGPQIVEAWIIATNNPLISLEGLPERLGKGITLTWHPDLPLLRLLKIREFTLKLPGSDTKIQRQVTAILKKYNKKTVARSEIIACQNELIAAGYPGNARW